MGAQHKTPEHRAEKERQRVDVEAGDGWCAERVCLFELEGGSRWIDPDVHEWAAAHDHTDPTGQSYLGPAHARCNNSEGARRGNRQRKQREATAQASDYRPVIASRRW